MTNNNYFKRIFFFSIIVITILLFRDQLTNNRNVHNIDLKHSKNKPSLLNKEATIAYVNRSQDKTPPSLDIKNRSKMKIEQWEKPLYETLLTQGKNSLSSIELIKERSYLWPISKRMKIPVETVRIKLKNLKNEESSFRAMVDARNGKILQTWDQIIEDPANPRDRVGIKLDPRYLE